MSNSKKPEFTPYPPRGVFYYRFFNKSPLGDLGVKIFQTCLILATVSLTNSKAVSQNNVSAVSPIKIGLLIQDSTYTSAIQGAELAVSIANEKGGMNGRKFQFVVRSMEGPWGTGSKQTVNLIFEEKVWALLGSHDDRNAHLVEQAATKSQVVFVSAWSGDPTLSQAFVPWFFNCVPNDNQQVASLIEEIYNKRKISRIAVVSGNDYDSKMTLNAFVKSAKTSGKPDPVQFNYDDYSKNLNDLTDVINKSDIKCVVLFCKPQEAIKVIRQIRQRKMDQPVFGSLTILNEDELSAGELQEFDDILSVPSGNWTGPGNMSFRQEFQRSFKRMPGMVASYSYDGMSVLIEAIRNAASSDREMIQKSLERIYLKGVTGPIQFDSKGNRMGKFEIMKTKNGLPIN
jgi:ABC-type branched-subunit amino acid transport system substrate-binding protein